MIKTKEENEEKTFKHTYKKVDYFPKKCLKSAHFVNSGVRLQFQTLKRADFAQKFNLSLCSRTN